MAYLYELFENCIARQVLAKIKIPDWIGENLKFEQRPYQQEAFKRFIFLDSEDFDPKPTKPVHLLYNMATGSGKTLIMAGLMLYLFQKGYRNFLFFVNSNNIIKKTKDNFLNPQASKYLFKNKIVIDGREVVIKEIKSFEETDSENINIKFTTIQQLHLDLNNTKENSVTYEDFENRPLVLIADEAHHLSTGTKSGITFGNWEDTVLKILNSNLNNLLLEFTATLDYESQELTEKYKNKVIYKYDLAQFRLDKYSKEINLIRSNYEDKERIIQALILNLYRQELATSHNINLKPVILFKAKRSIAESKKNQANFHKLIEELSAEMVEKIRATSTVPIVQKAFQFFETKGLSFNDIAQRIKANFKKESCISANNDTEAETNQILLNTLEDENNPVRAVFAVKKLDEGWDVLNLFDIVRLYEGRDGRFGKPGKTTISEAQLIGRGARYFPFSIEEGQDPFTRKFDDDVSNDLKILEELYYHTKEDSRYISELKQALVNTGIYEDNENSVTLKLELKPSFKASEFYQRGRVIFNKKVKKGYNNVRSFADLGVKKKNFRHTLSSGVGKMIGIFTQEAGYEIPDNFEQKEILIKDIPGHIIRFALSQNPFFHFDNLVKYFPNIPSLSHFIESDDYLSGLEITFSGTKDRLSTINNYDYLMAMNGLLTTIELEIKSNITEFEGSDYIYDFIHNIFKDKIIKIPQNSIKADGQFDLISKSEWYVYNANYGTSEEKEFVKMFARRINYLKKKFKEIYLIRNERTLKIYDKHGRAFEPDFILFCKQTEDEGLTYQVFIESKGAHLIAKDKWKENFLKEMRDKKRIIKIGTDQYLVTGVPFYNNNNEKEFKETLEKVLND